MARESCKSQIAVLEMNGQSVPQRWTSMREGSNTARRQCSAWNVELSGIRRAKILASRESGCRVAPVSRSSIAERDRNWNNACLGWQSTVLRLELWSEWHKSQSCLRVCQRVIYLKKQNATITWLSRWQTLWDNYKYNWTTPTTTFTSVVLTMTVPYFTHKYLNNCLNCVGRVHVVICLLRVEERKTG